MTEAQQAEATGAPVEFTYNGETYTVSQDAISWDALELADAGKEVSALKAILGDAQWQRVKATTNPVRDGERFFQALMEAAGQGNSPASSSS